MDVYDLAREWLSLDKDASTRAEIERLVANEDVSELEKRLRNRITFGTAGLRAKAEAGFARMNCVTVIQTSQGFAQHLIDTRKRANLGGAGIVIGYDGRKDSRRFAEVAAAAFEAYGFPIIWFNDMVHTPLVPFAVKLKAAAGGVMITASHNPKDDNGYKVYDLNGCQINTPEDEAISASILRNMEPKSWKIPELVDQRLPIMAAYFRSLGYLFHGSSIPRFVYTPMHGVGLPYIFGALETIMKTNKIGVAMRLNIVPSQAEPDPDFPTVTYPNPEEYGALDLAKTHADSLGIDLIIANDPDADRLAVAQKVDGSWYQFKGDEIGTILGFFVCKSNITQAVARKPVAVTSAVSSGMLAAIGKKEGFDVVETLTGFKWIGNEAHKRGTQAIFGYEEALGYMIPSVVHDKDGIAAALTLLQACNYWNKLPFQALQDLYSKYGYFETMNTYFKSPNITTTKRIFESIRSDPMVLGRIIGEPTHCRVRDLVAGTDTGIGSGVASLPSSPENLMITVWLSRHPALFEGVRCTIRASGTEPKIKIYIECQSENSLNEARSGALGVLRAVRQQWFQDSSLRMEERYESESRS